MTDEPFCIDGCGRPATDERLSGIIMANEDFVEVVELVCTECSRHSNGVVTGSS